MQGVDSTTHGREKPPQEEVTPTQPQTQEIRDTVPKENPLPGGLVSRTSTNPLPGGLVSRTGKNPLLGGQVSRTSSNPPKEDRVAETTRNGLTHPHTQGGQLSRTGKHPSRGEQDTRNNLESIKGKKSKAKNIPQGTPKKKQINQKE